jgi:hypothetical protein
MCFVCTNLSKLTGLFARDESNIKVDEWQNRLMYP